MKKGEIPQHKSALEGFTKEISYVVDEEGNYTTAKSSGWDVKTDALNVALGDVEKNILAAKEKVQKGEASPLLFFMEKRIMDVGILASYTGLWKWTVKRHLKPSVFKKLSDEKLKKYAEIFEVSLEELKKPFSQ